MWMQIGLNLEDAYVEEGGKEFEYKWAGEGRKRCSVVDWRKLEGVKEELKNVDTNELDSEGVMSEDEDGLS